VLLKVIKTRLHGAAVIGDQRLPAPPCPDAPILAPPPGPGTAVTLQRSTG
jgi:hypothetical protein